MTQLHEKMTVPPDHILRLRVPNARSGEEVDVFVLSTESAQSLQSKRNLMEQAASDPLFRADVDETMADFSAIDFENIP